MQYIRPYDKSGFTAKMKKRMPYILAQFLLQVFTNWSFPLLISQKYMKKGQICKQLFVFS